MEEVKAKAEQEIRKIEARVKHNKRRDIESLKKKPLTKRLEETRNERTL
jgi:hypothetical protein